MKRGMMGNTLATTEDAVLILQLYDLRREQTMRAARKWVAFDFQPKTFEAFIALGRDMALPENAYWRQVLSYWEMAHSFVLRGAIDADLFLDTQGEGIFIYAKFARFQEEYKQATGNTFMKQTAELVEKYPAAKERFDEVTKRLSAQWAEAGG